MYRYIKKIPVLSSAMRKSDIKRRIESYSDQIELHMVKCVVYGDDLNCLNHWIHEISNWVHAASAAKPKSGKLSEGFYRECLFHSLGDEIDDSKFLLLDFEVQVDQGKYKGKYPEFDVTVSMIERLYEFSRLMMQRVPKIVSKQNATLAEIKSLVLSCYNDSK